MRDSARRASERETPRTSRDRSRSQRLRWPATVVLGALLLGSVIVGPVAATDTERDGAIGTAPGTPATPADDRPAADRPAAAVPANQVGSPVHADAFLLALLSMSSIVCAGLLLRQF